MSSNTLCALVLEQRLFLGLYVAFGHFVCAFQPDLVCRRPVKVGISSGLRLEPCLALFFGSLEGIKLPVERLDIELVPQSARNTLLQHDSLV